jgi:hypothetical protein
LPAGRCKEAAVHKSNGAGFRRRRFDIYIEDEEDDAEEDDELLADASLCIMECHQEQPETEAPRAVIAARARMREERLRMVELLI